MPLPPLLPLLQLGRHRPKLLECMGQAASAARVAVLLLSAGCQPQRCPSPRLLAVPCAAERWPHINISDSLVMADGAVKMAEAGCK